MAIAPKKILLAFILVSFGEFIDTNSQTRDTCASPLSKENNCYVRGEDILQVVLIQDRTESYVEFSREFEKILPELLKKISGEFPNSEFGITSFADYSKEQRPIGVPRGRSMKKVAQTRPDSSTGCYLHRLNFTKTHVEVEKTFKSTPFVVSGGNAESSLTGIFFTAAEKHLKWSPRSCDAFESQTFRVMILLTEEVSTTALKTDKDRSDPKGDGTDTCELSKIPTPSKIKEVLTQKDINMVAVLTQGQVRPHIEAIWRKYFIEFGYQNPQIVVNDGGSSLVDKIFDAITTSIGEECEMADPPAYNTLGL